MQKRLHARTRAVYIWLMAPLLGLAVFVAVFASVAAPVATAAASSNLNFQARLLTNTGSVVPDGNYNIDFKLYTADSTTGSVGTCTGSCVWEETRKNSNSQGVQVINGYFSVNLGSVTAFGGGINWDQQLWLTMNIGGTSVGASPTWDGEMQNAGHSIALTALPYAFTAGSLSSGTGASRGTLGFASLGQATTITLPDPGGASATVCYQGSAACNFIQNTTGGPQTANFNIQSSAVGSIGGIINAASGQTADLFELKNSSTVVFGVGNNGQTVHKPTASNDSATFFQVQNAATKAILTVDTASSQLVLGTAGTGGLNGKIVFSTTNAGSTTITLAAASITSSYSLVLPTTAPALGQCLQNDGTTLGQLTFGACGASGTFVNFAPSSVQADSTTNSSIFINKTGASGNLLTLQKSGATVLSVGNTGATMIQNGSTAALQVQNTSSKGVLTVDTSNGQTILGTSGAGGVNGALLFQNSTNTNGITLNTTGGSSTYSLTLPTAAPAGGLCIETQPGNASQLVFASCSNNNASIQQVAYWDTNNQTTVSVSPTTAGDEMVLTTQIPTGGVTVTGVAGGGVPVGGWSKVVANSGNVTVNRVEMWVGTVTTTGSSTITVTYSSSPGSNEIATTEFTAAGVNASTSWGIESSASQLNSTASTTVTYPNVTAVSGSELYVGYAQVQNPPASNGAGCNTSNFSYQLTSTQHNMITYNTSLTANTAYQPIACQNTSGQSNTVAGVLTAFVTSSSINNTTSLQKANFYVQAATASTVAGVLQAASSTPGDILDLRNGGGTNVVTVSSAGNVLVKPAASATAFQVQNGSGYSVMAVDTSGNSVVLGDATHLSGSITFKDSGDSNTVSISAPSSVATTYNLLLPSNAPTAGLCLSTSPSNANQLIFSSCATQVSAATITYVNKWDNNGSGVTNISTVSPTSIGDLMVFYSHTGSGGTINTISGGGVPAGGWTKVTAYTGAGTPGNIEMWRGVVTTAGASAINVTYTGTAGTNEIVAEEFTMGSANGTWAIDTSGTATTTSSVTTVNYPSLTPLNSNELYTGYAYGGGTMSLSSPTSGFTYVATGATKYLTYKTNVTGGTPYAPVAQQTSGVYASIAALIEAYVGTSVIVNTTSAQQANFNVQASLSGTVAGVLQGASSGTADVLQVKDGSGINVMTVNTSNVNGVDGVTLGAAGSVSGQLTFNSSGNTNSITIAAPSAPGSSYILTLPTTTPAAGQCLATSPSNANQLVFSSCANQVTSVAITFVNSWKSTSNTQNPTLSVSPANLGDLITLFIYSSKGNSTTGPPIGGGVSVWTKIVSANAEEMWRGQVTSTGSSTISVSVGTPASPTEELAAQEWTTGSNNGSWVIDTSGTISNSSNTTVTYPNLTPQSSKDLYIGYAVGTSTMSAGSTSGFSYLSGAGSSFYAAYNTTVSTGVQPTASQASPGTSIAAAALIAAYSSSSVIANSTNTQQANFNIQAATSGSVAGTLQAFFTGTGDILDLLDGNGTLTDKFDYQGNLLVRPSTAGATAFQVQNTSNVNVLSVDTSAKQVVIGAGSAGETTPSLLVLDNQTGSSADPSGVNGAMYYNATNHTFRCYESGAWQNCAGMLYSNTSTPGTAISSCTTACPAFSTVANIPANYCQAGRVITVKARGYYNTSATTFGGFGLYYGTDGTTTGQTSANNVLLGSTTQATGTISATSWIWMLDFDIICYSPSSMMVSGMSTIQNAALSSTVGTITWPLTNTAATTVVSNVQKNLYIFPSFGASAAGNNANITQMIVTSD